MPPAAPMPWKSRMPTNTYIVGEKMQITVEATNSSRETRSSGRRPNLSLSGPKRSWPSARPAMLAVRPICTIDCEVPK